MSYFCFEAEKRIEHERPREGASRPLAVRGGGRRASEQIRSIESMLAYEQGDYICEVRRREAARQNLSISAKKSAFVRMRIFLSRPQAWHRRSQARYSVASLLTSPREVRCISSAPAGLYLITRQRAFSCGLMISRPSV